MGFKEDFIYFIKITLFSISRFVYIFTCKDLNIELNVIILDKNMKIELFTFCVLNSKKKGILN